MGDAAEEVNSLEFQFSLRDSARRIGACEEASDVSILFARFRARSRSAAWAEYLFQFSLRDSSSTASLATGAFPSFNSLCEILIGFPSANYYDSYPFQFSLRDSRFEQKVEVQTMILFQFSLRDSGPLSLKCFASAVSSFNSLCEIPTKAVLGIGFTSIMFQFSLRDSAIFHLGNQYFTLCFNSLCEIQHKNAGQQAVDGEFQFSLRDSQFRAWRWVWPTGCFNSLCEIPKEGLQSADTSHLFQFSLRDSHSIHFSQALRVAVSILFARFRFRLRHRQLRRWVSILFARFVNPSRRLRNKSLLRFNSLCEIPSWSFSRIFSYNGFQFSLRDSISTNYMSRIRHACFNSLCEIHS